MHSSRRSALKVLGGATFSGLLVGRSRAQSADPDTWWPMDDHDAGATNAALNTRVESITTRPGRDLIVASGTRFYRRSGEDLPLLVAKGNANWESDRPVLGTPVYENESIYTAVLDEDRTRFVAFDAETGAVRWELPLVDDVPDGDTRTENGQREWQSPLRLCGSFVYGVSGDRLYCVDIGGQRIQWAKHGPFVDLAVESGVVVTAGDGIRAFDDRTGDPVWQVDGIPGGNVATRAGHLVHTDTAIRVFDVADGTEQWEEQVSEYESPTVGQLAPDFLTEPTIAGDTVYVGVNRSTLAPFIGRFSGDVRGYDLSTGQARGRLSPPSVAEIEPGSDAPPAGPGGDGEWLTLQWQNWSSPVRASDGIYIGYGDSLMSFEIDGGGHHVTSVDGLARVSVDDSGRLQNAERITDWSHNEALVVADTTLYQ